MLSSFIVKLKMFINYQFRRVLTLFIISLFVAWKMFRVDVLSHRICLLYISQFCVMNSKNRLEQSLHPRKKIKCNSKTVIQPPITLKITVNSFTKTKQRERKRKIKQNSDKKKTIMSQLMAGYWTFISSFRSTSTRCTFVYGTPRQTIHIRMNLLCVCVSTAGALRFVR